MCLNSRSLMADLAVFHSGSDRKFTNWLLISMFLCGQDLMLFVRAYMEMAAFLFLITVK